MSSRELTGQITSSEQIKVIILKAETFTDSNVFRITVLPRTVYAWLNLENRLFEIYLKPMIGALQKREDAKARGAELPRMKSMHQKKRTHPFFPSLNIFSFWKLSLWINLYSVFFILSCEFVIIYYSISSSNTKMKVIFSYNKNKIAKSQSVHPNRDLRTCNISTLFPQRDGFN